MLKTKSVESSIDRDGDGLRILATRFRGRGMSTDRYDVWMPSLGPSEQLLRAAQSGKKSWTQFSREFVARAVHGRTHRFTQPDDQEPRAEVHAAADQGSRSQGKRHADVSLRGRSAALSQASVAEANLQPSSLAARPTGARLAPISNSRDSRSRVKHVRRPDCRVDRPRP